MIALTRTRARIVPTVLKTWLAVEVSIAFLFNVSILSLRSGTLSLAVRVAITAGLSWWDCGGRVQRAGGLHEVHIGRQYQTKGCARDGARGRGALETTRRECSNSDTRPVSWRPCCWDSSSGYLRRLLEVVDRIVEASGPLFLFHSLFLFWRSSCSVALGFSPESTYH